jgi:hypothetical protein
MAKPIPPFTSPITGKDGRLTDDWWKYFDKVSKPNTKTPAAVTLTASPCVLTADDDGLYIISGGTVSAVEIQRNGAAYVNFGVVAGSFPVQKSDSLRITYTVAPTATFLGG